METITGMLPYLNAGMLGQKAYSMIITDQRIIVAKFSNKRFKEELNKHNKELKDQGVGALGRMKESMGYTNTYIQRYFQMQPDDILNEDSENYSLTPQQINKIKFKQGHTYSDSDSQYTKPNEIIIKHTNGKTAFKFQQPTVKEAQQLLQGLLGHTFK